MKTLYFYMIIGVLAVASCNTNKDQAEEKMSFEIYGTLKQMEVPNSLIEEFRRMDIELNTDARSPIIGFVPIDSTTQLSKIAGDNVKFLQTVHPVDKDKKYLAIVAVKKQPDLNTSDIKKTKPNQNNIEVYFNLQGSRKWADLTKDNIGKMIAFSMDNKIYTLTSVNGEIKSGIAVVNGLENGDMASEISKSINSGLKD